MTPEIKAAFEAWQKAEDKIPENEYEKGYKSRKATARKKYSLFSDLCKSSGLDTSKTAYDLMGMKDTVITRAKQ